MRERERERTLEGNRVDEIGWTCRDVIETVDDDALDSLLAYSYILIPNVLIVVEHVSGQDTLANVTQERERRTAGNFNRCIADREKAGGNAGRRMRSERLDVSLAAFHASRPLLLSISLKGVCVCVTRTSKGNGGNGTGDEGHSERVRSLSFLLDDVAADDACVCV